MKYEFKCMECQRLIKIKELDISKILKCKNCKHEYNINEIIHLSKGGDQRKIGMKEMNGGSGTNGVNFLPVILGGCFLCISGVFQIISEIFATNLENLELVKNLGRISSICIFMGGLFLMGMLFSGSNKN